MTATIVVVEDNALNMKLMDQALTFAGYQVVPSVDGDGLADLVAGVKAGLVLMDIQLPRWSGIELLQQLKADARTAAVPVLAVTAFADRDSMAGFLADGFDQVITKPISIRALLDALDRHCPLAVSPR